MAQLTNTSFIVAARPMIRSNAAHAFNTKAAIKMCPFELAERLFTTTSNGNMVYQHNSQKDHSFLLGTKKSCATAANKKILGRFASMRREPYLLQGTRKPFTKASHVSFMAAALREDLYRLLQCTMRPCVTMAQKPPANTTNTEIQCYCTERITG